MIQRATEWSKRRELRSANKEYVDPETGVIVDPNLLNRLEKDFPKPWPHFDVELCLRAGLDRSTGAVCSDLSTAQVQQHLTALGYDDTALATSKPLFVSRAPKRLGSGAAHKETIYATRPSDDLPNRVTQKLALTDLTLAHFGGQNYDAENCSLIEPHRNQRLYQALHQRLLEHGGKADKAFGKDKPFFKPGKNGEAGPLVRTVTLQIDKLSGIPVRGGVAKNDSMIRVDVFSKSGKFHLVPVYVHHRVAKALPDRAIVQGKDEDEWTLIDDSFEFRFSLYPNDLLKIQQKNKPLIEGYYAGCNRATGSIDVWLHDRNTALGKEGLIQSIGIKLALSVEKFHVDVLGRIYPAKPESRRGLA
jgi:CRISPR-associated endonuclease Csn1